jgi:plastocyanin
MRTRTRSMTLATLTVAALGWGLFQPVSALKPLVHTSDTTDSLVTVNIRDNFFSPRNLVIARGTSVTWVNRGEDDHTTTSSTGLWDRELAPGQSFTRLFNRQGTFRYFCRFHDEMSGAIRVSP